MLISIVIPAYNEEKYIGETLLSLVNQEIKGVKREIIVVDAQSTDKTLEEARKLGAKILSVPRKTPAFARQEGIKAARGEIIACIDADTIAAPDWLRQISRLFKDENLIGLTGSVIPRDGFLKRIFLEYLNIIFYKINFFLGKTVFNGQNFAARKKNIFKIGGFNTGLYSAEDADLGLRLGKIGKVILAPSVKVYTSTRRTKEGFFSPLLYRWFFSYLKVVWKIKIGNFEKKPFPAIR